MFPDQQTVLEYIESYASHFDFLRHIQFNNKVLRLSYEDNGDSISGLINNTTYNWDYKGPKTVTKWKETPA